MSEIIIHCPFCKTLLVNIGPAKYCDSTFYRKNSELEYGHFDVNSDKVVSYRSSDKDDPSFHWATKTSYFHYYSPNGESTLMSSKKQIHSIEEFVSYVDILIQSFLFM